MSNNFQGWFLFKAKSGVCCKAWLHGKTQDDLLDAKKLVDTVASLDSDSEH